MISLSRPPYEALSVFKKCASHIAKTAGTALDASEVARVQARDQLFTSLAEAHALHTLQRQDSLTYSPDELKAMYTSHLLGSERDIYDGIKAGARHGACPLCADGEATQLDHFLPKDSWNDLAVFPLNLVPVCTDCNREKRNYSATTASEEFFHPYFDSWPAGIIRAEITIGHELLAEFYVDRDACPDAIIADRAEAHFSRLKLGPRFAFRSELDLVRRRGQFVDHFASGANHLLAELEISAAAQLSPFPNTWQPALYAALVECEPFWTGGFLRIPA